jgi:hypothetical protein
MTKTRNVQRSEVSRSPRRMGRTGWVVKKPATLERWVGAAEFWYVDWNPDECMVLPHDLRLEGWAEELLSLKWGSGYIFWVIREWD